MSVRIRIINDRMMYCKAKLCLDCIKHLTCDTRKEVEKQIVAVKVEVVGCPNFKSVP